MMDERLLRAQKKANELVDTIKQITYPDDFSRLERIAIADGERYVFIAQGIYQLYNLRKLGLDKNKKIPHENFIQILSMLNEAYKKQSLQKFREKYSLGV
ncbi:MAG: hypothetical protein OH354_02160 [Candidatus Parvarchaeota archaeon]|nr:hypothetical protein [Candidatus Jingweiarchaeum tengchongense]MCW1300212.1 hypothetical protein [Candidatus Jingweiarchaeum tengchongense]MCW1304554.1 hypothetical protein [Candidatus Jingweiarchaeum tengchongense]MCW1305718.1 hypothetical protein [Candidatus Jingweiarchaeum tengchongense]MCW1310006.1 hypothetical protein [Candidatus Jingweiarchaeum tengchongense]